MKVIERAAFPARMWEKVSDNRTKQLSVNRHWFIFDVFSLTSTLSRRWNLVRTMRRLWNRLTRTWFIGPVSSDTNVNSALPRSHSTSSVSASSHSNDSKLPTYIHHSFHTLKLIFAEISLVSFNLYSKGQIVFCYLMFFILFKWRVNCKCMIFQEETGPP